MKTIIDIPEDQAAPLSELCQRTRISRAEAIRRAIALFLQLHRDPDKAAFGLWKGTEIDGEEYQRTLRGEWEE